MAKKKHIGSEVLAENRKAYFHYEVVEHLECGIVLHGTEVKSMRMHHINFVDAFCEIRNHELFVLKLNISPYDFGNINNHTAERPRKLLAHKQEIRKLQRRVAEKGMTLIPLKFYLKDHLVKVDIGLCRGKKLYDKRESIKERDMDRQASRETSRLY
jgi:SsrA-binding protein